MTSSQLALAWVLSRSDDVVPIPGTKRRRYLEENVAAVEVELTAADIDDIESVFPKGRRRRRALRRHVQRRPLMSVL